MLFSIMNLIFGGVANLLHSCVYGFLPSDTLTARSTYNAHFLRNVVDCTLNF